MQCGAILYSITKVLTIFYLLIFFIFGNFYKCILIFRNQEPCASSKVFIASNFVQEKFLCYLLPSKNQLLCVELEFTEANTSDLNLGNTTVLIAKDAEYLPVIIDHTFL